MGWGSTNDLVPFPPADDGPGELRHVPEWLKLEMIDDAVNVLGINRIRVQGQYRGKEWEPVNDNDDPNKINWAAFRTRFLDAKMSYFILPLKKAVEARGDPFDYYISFNNYPGAMPAHLTGTSDEFVEFYFSFVKYLAEKHKLPPNYIVLQNEPGHADKHTSPAWHATMIKKLGPKFRALGIPTKIQFQDQIAPPGLWHYINALKNDSKVWPHVGVLSYHVYGKLDPARSQIRDFGIAKGIPRASTEGAMFRHLYGDLTEGGCSYWEISYGFSGINDWSADGAIYNVNFNRTSFSRRRGFWKIRQVSAYARPGAVRIDATVTGGTMKALAFIKDKKVTVMLLSDGQKGTTTIKGLPEGTYGISKSPYGEELGLRTVKKGGSLSVDNAKFTRQVLTVYPYSGANNAPFISEWSSSPRFITRPRADRVAVALRAYDAELNDLTHSWAVKSQPKGAAAKFRSPSSARTVVTGLTVPGEYIFTGTVSDGKASSKHDIRVPVYKGNHPPFVWFLQYRNPSLIIAGKDSSCLLLGKASDVNRDKVTYLWSVISSPAGTSPRFESPTGSKNSARTKVSGLTKAGDYVLRLQVKDGLNTVYEKLRITVFDPKSSKRPPPR